MGNVKLNALQESYEDVAKNPAIPFLEKLILLDKYNTAIIDEVRQIEESEPTLGDIANFLEPLYRKGVTKESMLYVIEKVWG